MEELLADELALLAGERDERRDLLGDVFSCSSARRTGATASANDVFGASTPGIVTSSSASSRYWTRIIAWFRSSTAWR